MVAETTEYEDTTWLQRIRSTVLLLLLTAVLGAVTAGIIGVLVVAGASLIDHALG
jgi:integral membrane sensor domain MASE1